MLETYREMIVSAPASTRRVIQREFHLPPIGARNMYSRLVALGVQQADLVVALLRENVAECVQLAERLVGKPITHLPPHPYLRSYMHPAPVVHKTRPRIYRKSSINPCLPSTPAFARWELLRQGMSVEAAVARGVTRRDLREWVRWGWLEIRTR